MISYVEVAAANFLRTLSNALRAVLGVCLRDSSSIPPLLTMMAVMMALASSAEIEAMTKQSGKDRETLIVVLRRKTSWGHDYALSKDTSSHATQRSK